MDDTFLTFHVFLHQDNLVYPMSPVLKKLLREGQDGLGKQAIRLLLNSAASLVNGNSGKQGLKEVRFIFVLFGVFDITTNQFRAITDDVHGRNVCGAGEGSGLWLGPFSVEI
jgi:hypothetical protein